MCSIHKIVRYLLFSLSSVFLFFRTWQKIVYLIHTHMKMSQHTKLHTHIHLHPIITERICKLCWIHRYEKNVTMIKITFNRLPLNTIPLVYLYMVTDCIFNNFENFLLNMLPVSIQNIWKSNESICLNH